MQNKPARLSGTPVTEAGVTEVDSRSQGFSDILFSRKRRLEMEAQRDLLDQKIVQARAEAVAARESTLLQILDAMDECGITSEDILSHRPLPFTFPEFKRRVKVARYFDPDSDKNWDGRGLRPHWFQQHVKNGGSPEDLMVKKFYTTK